MNADDGLRVALRDPAGNKYTQVVHEHDRDKAVAVVKALASMPDVEVIDVSVVEDAFGPEPEGVTYQEDSDGEG